MKKNPKSLTLNYISILGGLLTIIGLFMPWFYVTVYAREGWASIYTIPVQIAPFYLQSEIQGKIIVQWFEINLGANIIGVTCIIGSISGLIGGLSDNDNFKIFGGILTIISPLLFLSVLPRHDLHINIGPGGIFTTFSGILMFLSLLIKIPGSEKNIKRSFRRINV
jgi:hypothetical protein